MFYVDLPPEKRKEKLLELIASLKDDIRWHETSIKRKRGTAEEFEKMLLETEEEIGKMPMFSRPVETK